MTTAGAGTAPGYPGPSALLTALPTCDRVLVRGQCQVRHAGWIADAGYMRGSGIAQGASSFAITQQLDERRNPAVGVVEPNHPAGDAIVHQIVERRDVRDDNGTSDC